MVIKIVEKDGSYMVRQNVVAYEVNVNGGVRVIEIMGGKINTIDYLKGTSVEILSLTVF